ncbi:aminotransferase class V-fold PLP-dependent enzyme [uncultured Oscillibacter sp.]|uniref:aminotransferase class V-fold PLP-dependent enzyme n=1 Tax=uncultured Oscillibacter sp. TaxID=876091 RepID=UPI0025FE65F7|nr:aminotransferase class V-fold PLP-dependent enzyme [uncultured Oscillibacter sp.]
MIYLDSAATTFQKPPEVTEAVREAMATMSSPGRGGYRSAMLAADTAFACRSELAELYHLESPEQVVFTMNATHALNIAIKSLVPPGGHAVISGYEHNAVTRPLHALGARVDVAAGPLFDPEQTADAFAHLIVPGVDAVICNHVSNVFGYVQPVEQVAALCRARGVPLIVDASQSAGILALDQAALAAAFIAMPGHKGLYGPQGTGVLLCGPGTTVRPLMEGGTGSLSIQQQMPEFLPDRLEAGTHNVPGIAGLLAGVRFVRRVGPENICYQERVLARQAALGLMSMPGVQVYARPDLASQAGVLSFTAAGRDVEQIAAALGQRDIAVRAGLHCAPAAHRQAGTLETGTVRLSFSHWNTAGEVEHFLEAMGQILG